MNARLSSTRRRLVPLIVLSALSTIGTLEPATAATPTALICGQVITSSIIVTADLTNCPLGGIVIAADDITIDLGGHTISGDNVDDPNVTEVGIEDPVGHTGVTVKNGTVADFDQGVRIGGTGAASDLLRTLTVESNTFGIVLAGASDTLIERNVLRDNTEIGLVVDDESTGNRLRANSVTSNKDGVLIQGNNTARNVVRENAILANSGSGVLLVSSDENVVALNVVTGNGGYGIFAFVGSDANRFRRNVVRTNGSFGIRIDASERNRIRENVVTDTPTGIAFSNGTGNAAIGNRIKRSASLGLWVMSGTEERLGRNVVLGSGGDGIVVAGSSHVLRENVSNGNGGYGIEASGGTGIQAKANTCRRNTAGRSDPPGLC
jgi:large repetitive protein